MIKIVKKLLRYLLPSALFKHYHLHKSLRAFWGLSTKEVFNKIYQEGAWGDSQDEGQRFFSGPGSHDVQVVSAYVDAVSRFLSEFQQKPTVVDLGCGDFNIGSKLRQFCEDYVACDIVEDLIDFNKRKFESLDVNFRVLDITSEPLPKGDVVFIRQVLQHLSNKQILRVIPKIQENFNFIVLTEHLPAEQNFKPNKDKPAGPNIRTEVDSGIVITQAPFNLSYVMQKELCRVHNQDGVIVTTVYQLRQL